MAANLETIIKQLSESSIISQGKLDNFVPPMAHPKTVEELVAELVKQNHLTPFQAQQVKLGKAKALILGNYTILDVIGAGGMGQVFKAEHRRMERIVALKMLPPAMNKNASALARFQREVKAAARLRHTNIVGADDADEANGSHFLVMEYVEGRDLSAYVKKLGPFSVDKAVNYTLQAARGLEFAHAEGVVHRDIKPGNLLLDKKGVVKILDMGFAHIDVAPGDVAAQAELTGTGAVMGTVDYMAPEQGINTHDVDARADIYSLGCTLHYLLLGKPVYEGQTVGAEFLAHHRQPVPDLTELRSDLQPQVNAAFQKMVAKQPEDRYQSMTEVIAALQACSVGDSESLTMQRTIGSSSDNSTLKSIRTGALALKRGAKKKAGSTGGDKKKLIYAGAGAAALVLLTVVFLLRGNKDEPVAEVNSLAPVVSEAKVESPVTVPVSTAPIKTLDASTPIAKVDPPATKPIIDKPATTTTPVEMAPAAVPVPVAKTGPPVAKPIVVKPVPAATPAEKKPAPIVVAKVEPPAAKPTANEPVRTAPPVAKPVVSAPPVVVKIEPPVVKNARLPIPDDAAQNEQNNFAQDLFKADLAQAKLPEQKAAVAEKFLTQADATRDDTASKYAMLQEARRLAADAGDARLMEVTIDTLASGYTVNAAEMWIESLEKAGQKPRLPPLNKSLAEAALDQLDRLESEDNFDLAARLQVAALAPARKARDPSLLKEVVERGKLLSAGRKQAESMEKTREILAKQPDDAAANLALGRYLCFTRRAWKDGFIHLAKGSDPTLAKLATRSLAGLSDPAGQLALAEAWWKAAESAKGVDSTELQIGAGYCYAKALPQLAGLAKSVAEQRIQSLPPKIAQELFDSAAQAWIDEIAALPAERQLEAVGRKMEQLNPGFTSQFKSRIERGAVTELAIDGKFIVDLSPVRALVELKSLRCPDAKLSDLSPLRGMKLDSLTVYRCPDLKDITPLKGMKLTVLDIGSSKVDDLSPLRGMKLTQLSLRGCVLVSDLEPLRGMPLNMLSVGNPRIQDFSLLAGMKLNKLDLGSSAQFRDLEMLRGMKLIQLQIDGTGVTDLTPLRGMSLEVIWLTPKNIVAGMDLLRNMTTLRTIGVDSSHYWPAAEFWRRYDAGEFR